MKKRRPSATSKLPLSLSFDARAPKAETLVVFATEGDKLAKFTPSARVLDDASGGALTRAATADAFHGKKGQMLTLAGPAKIAAKHVVVIGLGKAKETTLRDLEKTALPLVQVLNARKIASVSISGVDEVDFKDGSTQEAAACLAVALQMSAYRFDKYFTRGGREKKPSLSKISLVTRSAAAAKKLYATEEKVAHGVYLTRDLVSEVPNVLYPESFAAIIKRELSPLGIEVRVLDVKDMSKLNMGALLAVGQGSARPPRLVTMRYNGGKKGQKPVAFVGKGVTFDTGGISIKPAPGMEDMKWDMAGAGAVVGVMKTLAARKAKANIVGVVALTENMPGGKACRPGDVVGTMSGQTVEILNTDAEGRLILCDALTYTQEKFSPSHVVDLATLTGAVLIALGQEFAGMFSNDDAFATNLRKAGSAVGEELWQLPLHDSWDKSIDSSCADIKNISGNRDAGSAIGAHFLKRFIKDGTKWAHLDIAGMAWTGKDRPSTPKGASAFGVRLLDRFVRDQLEK